MELPDSQLKPSKPKLSSDMTIRSALLGSVQIHVSIRGIHIATLLPLRGALQLGV
jgi:hypothetical protein